MKVAAYVVEIWESERGWGSHLDDEYFFPGDENGLMKAQIFVDQFNKDSMPPADVVPDIYWRADQPFLRLVDEEKLKP